MRGGEIWNFLWAFCFLFPIALFGQDGSDEKDEKAQWQYELGFVYGGSIGAGPAFRSYIGPLGYQVAYAPLADPFNNDVVRSHVGFTLFYRPVRKEKIDFFVYQGNYWITAGGRQAHGIGIGTTFTFTGRIDMSVMGGYRVRRERVQEYGPTAEVGLYYSF